MQSVKHVVAHVHGRVLFVVVFALKTARSNKNGVPRGTSQQGPLDVRVRVVPNHVDLMQWRPSEGGQARSGAVVDGAKWLAKALDVQGPGGGVFKHVLQAEKEGAISQAWDAVRCSKMEVWSPAKQRDGLLHALVLPAWRTCRTQDIQQNLATSLRNDEDASR